MKKLKRIYAFMLSATMIINFTDGTTAYADDKKTAEMTMAEWDLRHYEEYVDDNEHISSDNDVILKSNYVNDVGSGYMYNMLATDDEKEFYSRLLTACKRVHESDADFERTDYAAFWDLSIDSDEAKEIAWIFHYDHPEFYWMNSSMRISSFYGISFYLYEDYQDGTIRRETTEAIEAVENQYISGAMNYKTEYDRAEYLFDTLSENVSYEFGDLDQSAASAFLDGKTVCAGYSKAYSLLCNSVGVEAVILIGYNHAWNAIKLSDTWYLVDVTNDIFLYSDDEMLYNDIYSDAIYQMTYTNSDGEEETFDFYMHDIASMEFPVYWSSFPKCPVSYNGTDGKTDVLATVSSETTTTTSTTSSLTTATTTASNTITTATSVVTTTVPSSTSTKQTETTVTTSDIHASKGDITIDGSIDLSDATLVLEIYAKNAAGISVDISEVQKDAGDINGNGILDINDATLILMYYAYNAAGLEVNWESIIENN